MPATPVHHTDTEDKSWDGPANKKNVETPVGKSTGNKVYGWYDPDGDLDTKAAWKFIHHHVDVGGTPGAANIKGCLSGIGVLNGGMGGSKIPAADRKGVWDHLAAHLKDAGEDDVPELKSARSARATMTGGRQVRTLDLRQVEVRDAADKPGMLEFSGYASTTEDPYDMYDCFGPYTEIIRKGAFIKTITEKKDIFLLGFHDSTIPVAGYVNQTLCLEEDDTGLKVTAYLDASDPDVQRLAAKLRSGLLTKMSFGFYVVRQAWSPDWMQRDILEVELIEVSVVTWPANDSTAAQLLAASIRSAVTSPSGAETARLRAIESEVAAGVLTDGSRSVLLPLIEEMGANWPDGAAQRTLVAVIDELRAGKTISASNQVVLQGILDHIAAIDVMVDEDQPKLADILGVDNPDDEDSSPCGSCGTMNDEVASYCDQCGASLSDDDTPNPDGGDTLSAPQKISLGLARARAEQYARQRKLVGGTA